MTVSIVKSSLADVNQKVKLLLEQLGYRPSKREVLLKPNVVGPATPERAIVTHPLVTGALIEYFRDHGCEVVIGESSSLAQDTGRCFEIAGYRALAQRYGVALVDLGKMPRVQKPWKFGLLDLPEMAFTHEYVNVAKMKTHIVTGVTLGMKNQKGLLQDQTKRQFHIKYLLDSVLQDLAEAISPQLTVIDAILALEGDGPGMGNPVDLGVLLAGTNVVEVDNVALQCMGYSPGEIKHIPRVDRIPVVGVPLEEVRRPFQRARHGQLNLGKVRFFSCRSCTGCTETFAISYHRGGGRAFSEPLDVIAGTEAALQTTEYPTVCYGDCSRDFARRNDLPHVEGCPPSAEETPRIPQLVRHEPPPAPRADEGEGDRGAA